MKAGMDEKRVAKKSDLKKMERKILDEDRKQDNKMYEKKHKKQKKYH